jgi:tetratricopeptide (TPR) repeat protein
VNREDRPADGRAVAALVAAYRLGVEERLHRAETERAAALVREGEQAKRRRLFFRLGGAIAAVLVLGIAGTSVGYVQASNAADAERKAKDDAIEQKTKAENRLILIRGTLNSFLNELPTIGHNLPLSEGVRRELMGHAITLVNSIREQSDLNDTYDFGINALTIRAAFEAAARGDHVTARQKVEAARDGFLRIVQSQPKLLDRARNNLAMAITELGRLAHIEKNYDRAAAYFQEALDMRREIAASPAGDLKPTEIDDAVAQSLMYFGLLESARRRFPEATSKLSEAKALSEKHLAAETDPHAREVALQNLVQVHVGFATVAGLQGKPEGLAQHYEIIIKLLTEELQRAPNSAVLRWSLIQQAYELAHRLIAEKKNAKRTAELLQIVQRQQRWFLDTKELVELQDKVGSIHYELGIVTDWLGNHDAAKKHYRRAEQYWSIMVDDLAESGEPSDSDKMIGRKILRMLAQARCGMVGETERFAAELLRLSESKDRPRDLKRNYSAQAAVGYSFCAVTFPPNSPERTAYFDKAMYAMRKSVEYGYKDWDYLATDADFEPLQGLPEFQMSLKEWREKSAKK